MNLTESDCARGGYLIVGTRPDGSRCVLPAHSGIAAEVRDRAEAERVADGFRRHLEGYTRIDVEAIRAWRLSAAPRPGRGEPCRHCGQRKVNRPLGLCCVCYYTPAVRVLYPSTSTYRSDKEIGR